MNAPRILIFEEDPNARSALGELLTDVGYEITTAATKRAALEAVNDFHPDVSWRPWKGESPSPSTSRTPYARCAARPPALAFISTERERTLRAKNGPARAAWVAKPIQLARLLRTLRRLTSSH